MTKVTFYQDCDGEILGVDAWGHAGYADAGEDIVCAAVSVLVLNTVNSIEAFTEDPFQTDVDEEEGRITLKFQQKPSRDAALLMKSLILGLQGMEEEEENMQYIDVIFEEV